MPTPPFQDILHIRILDYLYWRRGSLGRYLWLWIDWLRIAGSSVRRVINLVDVIAGSIESDYGRPWLALAPPKTIPHDSWYN